MMISRKTPHHTMMMMRTPHQTMSMRGAAQPQTRRWEDEAARSDDGRTYAKAGGDEMTEPPALNKTLRSSKPLSSIFSGTHPVRNGGHAPGARIIIIGRRWRKHAALKRNTPARGCVI